jgi:hypothetical protein
MRFERERLGWNAFGLEDLLQILDRLDFPSGRITRVELDERLKMLQRLWFDLGPVRLC